jgi:hypothetical protein
MVNINLLYLSEKFLFKIEWWVQVTVIPEEIRIIVFIRGISKGLKGLIPRGGHSWPISIDGAREEWKYAQKNEMKKKISEIINKIIPNRRPLYTDNVWDPW